MAKNLRHPDRVPAIDWGTLSRSRWRWSVRRNKKSRATGVSKEERAEGLRSQIAREEARLKSIRSTIRKFPQKLAEGRSYLETVRRRVAELEQQIQRCKEEQAAAEKRDRQAHPVRAIFSNALSRPVPQFSWMEPASAIPLRDEWLREIRNLFFNGYALRRARFRESETGRGVTGGDFSSRPKSIRRGRACTPRKENRLRAKYGVDEDTIAAAAAHFGKTRKLAEKIKFVLRRNSTRRRTARIAGFPLTIARTPTISIRCPREGYPLARTWS